jgi:hypothetical protein
MRLLPSIPALLLQTSMNSAKNFTRFTLQALGVISLERQEVKVEDVELGEMDYEGDNEEIMRVDPSSMRVAEPQLPALSLDL